MAITLSSILSFRRLLINSTSSRAYLSGFKSSISLDKLYPSSRLDITTIPEVRPLYELIRVEPT